MYVLFPAILGPVISNISVFLSIIISFDTYSVFKVDRFGQPAKDTSSTYATVRPVVYLNSRVLYKSGEGTLEKPYKVK